MKKTFLLLSMCLICLLQLKSNTAHVSASSVPDFTASAEGICVGQSVSFTDISTGEATKWEWTFEGGTPSVSVLQNPTITYTNSGVFSVTLTVTFTGEGELTVIKTGILKVFPIPVATFNFSGNQCQLTNSINFTNTGSTGVHAWSFAGGSPSSSSAANPSGVTFLTAGPHAVTHTVTDNGCSSTTSVNVTIFPAIASLAVAVTGANCLTGTGSFTIGATNGGTPPFLYSVNGGTFGTQTVFSNKTPGTYTATAEDSNGCRVKHIFQIAAPSPPTSIVISVTNTPCNQNLGKVSLGTITGGSPPYTLLFDGSVTTATLHTGLFADAYPVVVKDNKGCTFETFAIVGNTSGPTDFTVVATPETCSLGNGVINVTAVAGSGSPFKYSLDNVNYQTSPVFTDLPADLYSVFVKDNVGCLLPKTVNIINVAPTAIAFTVTPTACTASTGIIKLGDVTGGTFPYSFSFNGGSFTSTTTYTGLPAGAYQVVVEDAVGCTFTTSILLNNTSGPNNFDVAVTNETCGKDNGSINVISVSGGSGSFSQMKYSKDNTNFQASTLFPDLPATEYRISVKDNIGCIFSKTVSVLNLAPTDIAVSVTNTPCNASTGRILLGAVSGGTPNFSFSMNGSAFTNSVNYPGLPAGIYTVVVEDGNDCLFEKLVSVNNTAGPNNFTVAVANATCTGASNGTIHVTAVDGGSSPLSYSISNFSFQSSPVFPNLKADIYGVTVKDGIGCVLNKTVEVASIAPIAVVITVTNTPCNGNSGIVVLGNVTGGKSPYTFSFDGATFTTATTYTGLPSDVYPVIVKDANNCTFTTSAIVNNTSGPTDMTVFVIHDLCSQNGGFLGITSVIGGVPTLSYSIDNSAFGTGNNFANLAAGNHTLTVKDGAGCKLNVVKTILDVPGPSNFNFTKTNATCTLTTGSVQFGTVTGGTPPYTYFVNGTNFNNQTLITGLAPSQTSYTLKVRDNNGCTFSKTTVISQPTSYGPNGLSYSVKKAGCQTATDGAITITGITGGVPPYSYKFNNSQIFTMLTVYNGLSAGNHTFVVKDVFATCFYTAVVSVGTVAPGPNVVNVDPFPSDCGAADGTLTYTVSGSSPFSYSLDGPIVAPRVQSSSFFNNLPAGDYSLTITDANGCKSPVNVDKVWSADISNQSSSHWWEPYEGYGPRPTEISASVLTASCGLANGIIRNMVATEWGTTMEGDIGFKIKRVSTGSTTFVNNPETGLVTLNPGFYIITATGESVYQCDFSMKVFVDHITSLPTPTVFILSIGGILRSTATGGNQWFLNGVAIPGATSQNFNPSQNGNYFTRVTLGNCAIVNSNTVTVTNEGGRMTSVKNLSVAGEEEMINPFYMDVFPNPNDGNFNILFNTDVKSNYNLQVFNSLGQIVYADEFPMLIGSYSKQIHLADYGKGVYTVLLSGAGKRTVRKIVVY